MASFVTEAFRSIESDEKTSAMEARAFLNLLFSEIIKNEFIEANKNESKSIQFYRDVLSFIHSHYKENITSKEAASALSFNQSYFCRKFQNDFNESFSSYITRYRISMARQMLETDDIKLSDIAYECGFLNQSYFSKSFKKYTGISPSQYKKSM